MRRFLSCEWEYHNATEMLSNPCVRTCVCKQKQSFQWVYNYFQTQFSITFQVYYIINTLENNGKTRIALCIVAKNITPTVWIHTVS